MSCRIWNSPTGQYIWLDTARRYEITAPYIWNGIKQDIILYLPVHLWKKPAKLISFRAKASQISKIPKNCYVRSKGWSCPRDSNTSCQRAIRLKKKGFRSPAEMYARQYQYTIYRMLLMFFRAGIEQSSQISCERAAIEILSAVMCDRNKSRLGSQMSKHVLELSARRTMADCSVSIIPHKPIDETVRLHL